MKPLIAMCILIVACLSFSKEAGAAQKKKDAKRSYPYGYGYQGGVLTHPSSNPFSNPIGQGVPPAVSTSPGRNDRWMRAAPGATRQ